MKLSIIILNYNTAKITLDCLASIEKYPFSNNFEVILVDNASTDESHEILSKFRTKNYKYVFLQNSSNDGFSKGNNIGLKKSKGTYKLLLNSDTKVTRNALDRLIQTAEEESNIGIIGARLLNKDGSVQDSVFRLPTIIRSIQSYLLGNNILSKYAPNVKIPVEVEAVVGAAMLLTPEALKKVGTLDEKYFMYFEDLDYCRAVRKAGLKVFYEPRAEIIHLHGASGVSDWRRLIPSSKLYHGRLRHYLIFLITWLGSKINQH